MTLRLDFVAVGPQRTGTSWLDAALRAHPEVRLPENVKETFFFDERYDEGLGWYASHFGPEGDRTRATGEIGPTYYACGEAPARLRAAFGASCKVLITFRDPVARAVSLYRHHHNKGRVTGDILQAAQQIPEIVTAGHYREHTLRWLAAFGEAQVLPVVLDDLEREGQATYDRICAFLGVSQQSVPSVSAERIGSSKVSPRFPLLAKLGAASARRLRGARLHTLVEAGKRLGLKRVAYSGSRENRAISAAHEQYLRELYEPDVAFVRELVGAGDALWTNA